MRPGMEALRWLCLAGTLIAWECSSANNHAPAGTAGIGGVGPGGAGGAPAACLEGPTDLLRPPSGGLPCELIPPGLRL